MFGEVRVVDDVPDAFAALVTAEVAAHTGTFRLGCSGGSSGANSFRRLAEQPLPWSRITCLFADERCVAVDSADRNAVAIAAALGDRVAELAGFEVMDCEAGPGPYAALVAAGGFDLLQLGIGPDGHTASLFPGFDGAGLTDDVLVIRNLDPSGRNPFPRMSLTFAGIALARTVVITAIGSDKADPLARVAAGEPLPIAKVRAERVIWLVDPAANAGLTRSVGP